MRVLLVDDDPRFRALLRHHLTCIWPEAQIDSYDPVARGPVPEGFLAQAYDVVLLDHAWPGGDGFAWLADLGSRKGFAPVIFLLEDDAAGLAEAARRVGAFAAIATRKIDHEKLVSAVRAAALSQGQARSAWRGAAEARELQTFSGAYLPGYRRVRRIAGGSVSELFLAENIQAGTLVVLEGDARPPSLRRRRPGLQPLPPGIRDHPRHPPPARGAAVRPRRRRRLRLPGHGVLRARRPARADDAGR